MKPCKFFFICLALLAVLSCEKVQTNSKDVFTRGAEVSRDHVELTGSFTSNLDKASISELGFLISEKKGFKDKNGKRLPATMPEEKEFTLTATVEDDLDNKRDVQFYYKAYVIHNGKLLSGTERSFRTEAIPVASLSIDVTKAGIDKGKTLQILASVSPSNATHKEITWTSSNEKVATVSQSGLVTAHDKGQTTITAACGEFSQTCEVTVRGTRPAGFKDLGLSVYWAEKNLLAEAPEEPGEYYRFGYALTCQDFDPSRNPYSLPAVHPVTYDFGSSCDAATQLNSLWRTPSMSEFQELIDNCTRSSEEVNGIKVVRLTSKINNESLIFSSETGNMIQYRTKNQPNNPSDGPYGLFRSRTALGPSEYYSYTFYVINKYSTANLSTWYTVSSGIPIRPVSEGE